MFYDRQIKYLDYLENKERIRGVGFAKIEIRDNVCELHIQVNGMHVTDNFARKLMLVGEEEEVVLCEITFEKGRGNVDFQKLDSRNLAGSGIDYTQLYGIRIPIAAGKEIYCAIREKGEGKQSIDTEQLVQRPSEPRLSEPKPSEPKPSEPRPSEPRPSEPRLSEPKPFDSKSSEPRQAEETRQPVEQVAVQPDVEEAIQEREAQEREAQENRHQPQSQLQQDDDQMVGGMQTSINNSQSETELQPEECQQQAVHSQPVNMPITPDDVEPEKMPESTQDVTAQNIEDFVKKAWQANTPEIDGNKLNVEKGVAEVEGQESKAESRKIKIENPLSAGKSLQENKWKQLAAIYPHIMPFRDEREYLSISPGDFVILTEKYYNMANNSFLLHGYYNYKHLILSRLEKRGNIVYYVGVPGNFYEREKQVALLFGFESFECAEEPAQAGDYGYYMMKVEL